MDKEMQLNEQYEYTRESCSGEQIIYIRPPIFYSLSFSFPSIIIFYYFRTQPSQVLDFVHLVDIVNFLVHVVLFLGNISTFADDNIIIYIIYHTVVTKACCFVHPVLVERLFLLFSPVQ